jgi:hypothetical protein
MFLRNVSFQALEGHIFHGYKFSNLMFLDVVNILENTYKYIRFLLPISGQF